MIRSRCAALVLGVSFFITHIFLARTEFNHKPHDWGQHRATRWYQKDKNILIASCVISLVVEILRTQSDLGARKELPNISASIPQNQNSKSVRYREALAVPLRDQIPLPPEMKQLQQYEAVQLRSPLQDGGSCGWYMAFNAKALEEIIAREEPITTQAVSHRVCNHFVPLVKGQEGALKRLMGVVTILSGLTMDQIYELAHYLTIHNYYVLETDSTQERTLAAANKQAAFSTEPGVYSVRYGKVPFYEVPYLSSVLRTVKNDTSSLVHMFLSVPFNVCNRHAVLVTVIERGSKKPLLLYLDSNNSPLHNPQPELVLQSSAVKKCITTLDAA